MPAFIWSCGFSADSQRLAVANWNARTYLYQINRTDAAGGALAALTEQVMAPAPAEEGEPPPRWTLKEIGVAVRGDRCYAVDLDISGQYMATGGRDKKLAVYRYNADGGESGEGELELMWEKLADDFVYAVALSDDMQIAAQAGTAKNVVLYAASSGMALHTITVAGTIWSLMMYSRQKDKYLAVGGEFGAIKVFDVKSKKEMIHIPSAETAFDIALSQDTLAFTEATKACVYGFAGDFSWKDMPSYEVTTGWVMSMLAEEDELLHAMKLLLDRAPALVNSRNPTTGASLLHFAVLFTNQPKFMQMLLDSTCSVGLGSSVGLMYNVTSTIKLAITHGKLRLLQLMLQALRTSKFSNVPPALELTNEALGAMAAKYPQTFLEHFQNLKLQPCPEVLGETMAQDVMIPKSQVRGSDVRSPAGLWDELLSKFRVTMVGEEDDDTPPPGSAGQRPDSAGNDGRPGSAGKGAPKGAIVAPKKEDGIPMGFMKVAKPGPQALRIPFAHFAGRPPADLGNPDDRAKYKPPLELIVVAAQRTNDFQVFASPIVEILVDWKWLEFARWGFLGEFLFYCLNLSVVLLWNTSSSETAMRPMDVLYGKVPGESPHYYLFILWGWTSFICFTFAREQINKVCAIGINRYLNDVYALFDLFYVIAQGTVNALFWLRDMQPDLMYVIIDPIIAANYTTAIFGGLETVVYGEQLEHMLQGGHHRRLQEIDDYHHAAPAALAHGTANHFHRSPFAMGMEHGRLLRASGGGGDSEAGDVLLATGMEPGAFMSVQSMVVLTTFLRLLYFFRASIAYGSLVPCVVQIVVDTMPIVMLLLVISAAFSFSMLVLLQCELGVEAFPDYHEPFRMLFVTINMGLYTYYDGAALSLERHPQVLILYQIFMFMTQIVLLNMIIAIMAESFNKVRDVARYVALFERAQCILQWEHKHLARHSGVMGWVRKYGPSCFKLLPKRFRSKKPKKTPFPKWLHVLAPSETSIGGDTEAEHVSKKDLATGLGTLKTDILTKVEDSLSSSTTQNKEALIELAMSVKKLGSEISDLQAFMPHRDSKGRSARFSREGGS